MGLASIKAGTHNNNFNAQGVLVGAPADDKEAVGACLLDKVGAIASEGGVASFLNDLMVDLAACCTKTVPCDSNVEEAYSTLASFKTKKQTAKNGDAIVAAELLRAAEKLVSKTKVRSTHSKFFGK